MGLFPLKHDLKGLNSMFRSSVPVCQMGSIMLTFLQMLWDGLKLIKGKKKKKNIS